MTDAMNTKSRKKLILLWILFLVLAAGLVLGVRKYMQVKHEGTPLDSAAILPDTISFEADASITEAIQENYMAYLHKAYVLIGTYPDCQYYKISANVTRNQYDWVNDFYVPEGGLYKNYFQNGEKKGRVGIDVSQFQGTIDWNAVKEAGIEVAYVRLGYRGYGADGTLALDASYAANVDGAAAAGIPTGVYFYTEAVNREEGVEEANYVLQNLEGHNVSEPVVLDTEFMYNTEARANDISNEDRTAAILGFCETIQGAGRKVMIYASRDWFFFHMNIDEVGKYPFWLASYDTPVFPYHTEGYQYSQQGYVNGIPEAQVDLDVFMY